MYKKEEERIIKEKTGWKGTNREKQEKKECEETKKRRGSRRRALHVAFAVRTIAAVVGWRSVTFEFFTHLWNPTFTLPPHKLGERSPFLV